MTADPTRILDIATGYMASKQLFNAARIGLFRAVADGAHTPADVAAATGRSERQVRILLDGAVVHERKDFTAGEISPVVAIPLGDAKKLTLEVDFGANFGVQGQFNWIEPALLKSPASTAPAR